MDQAAKYQETLRSLTIFDETFVETRLSPGASAALDPKTIALLRVGVLVALGSSSGCLGWSTAQALTTGATKDEIADVLLAIAPVIGLERVISASPELATALEYDVDAALHEPNGN